ncbi:MAG: hypothetical protein ACRD3V_03740 [Vicinamibacteria bacterium]
MATALRPADHTVVLENVTWRTYEQLLADLVDSSAPRLIAAGVSCGRRSLVQIR